jgi:CubicO group peptidase (beta-lactamase class C family)
LLFEPGNGFEYSGEGFLFLQRALEEALGKPADELVKERLLQPLRMSSSSFVWHRALEATAADGHDRAGQPAYDIRPRYDEANVAFTLYTTAEDYARFLIEIMREDRTPAHSLGTQSIRSMLTPQVVVPGREPLVRSQGPTGGTSHFGLGWRIDITPTGRHFYHGGSNRTGFRCYAEFNPESGNGIVIMTNAVGGLELWGKVITLPWD